MTEDRLILHGFQQFLIISRKYLRVDLEMYKQGWAKTCETRPARPNLPNQALARLLARPVIDRYGFYFILFDLFYFLGFGRATGFMILVKYPPDSPDHLNNIRIKKNPGYFQFSLSLSPYLTASLSLSLSLSLFLSPSRFVSGSQPLSLPLLHSQRLSLPPSLSVTQHSLSLSLSLSFTVTMKAMVVTGFWWF